MLVECRCAMSISFTVMDMSTTATIYMLLWRFDRFHITAQTMLPVFTVKLHRPTSRKLPFCSCLGLPGPQSVSASVAFMPDRNVYPLGRISCMCRCPKVGPFFVKRKEMACPQNRLRKCWAEETDGRGDHGRRVQFHKRLVIRGSRIGFHATQRRSSNRCRPRYVHEVTTYCKLVFGWSAVDTVGACAS